MSKVCFITGGALRLGYAMGMTLAKERGYRIAFTYNLSQESAKRAAKEIKKYTDALPIKCNINKLKVLEKALEKTIYHFKRIDMVIVNASIYDSTPLLEITEKTWDMFLDTNLKSAFFTMQFAAKKMLDQPFPSKMVAMTDIATNLVWSKHAPYAVSKTGLAYLVKVFAKELAPKVLVNAVALGTILPAKTASRKKRKHDLLKIPLRELSQEKREKSVTDAILFLEKTDYITGETIKVDGGRSLV